jgi:hypothetical protein
MTATGRASAVPTVLMTESLGSKFLIDALLALLKESDTSTQQALLEQLGGEVTIFMLANQVPLLDLARDTPGTAAGVDADPGRTPPRSRPEDSLQLLLEQLIGPRPREAQTKSHTTAVTVVAATDPNDLLSYRLPRGRYEALFPGKVNVVNVIVSNDWTYFGYIERPDTAHQGYIANKALARAVFCGIRVSGCQF